MIFIKHIHNLCSAADSTIHRGKGKIEKLAQLPPQQLAEVEDFVDFLANKSRRRTAWEYLLSVAPALEAADISPISMDEINAEIQATRAENRAKTQAFSSNNIS